MVKPIDEMAPEEVATLFRNCITNVVKKNRFATNSAEKIIEIASHWSHTRATLDVGQDRNRPEFGVLRAIGYQVGNEGVDPKIRHWLLEYAMQGVLPPIKDRSYMEEWGEPESKKRFYKVKRVIEYLIEDHSNPNIFDKALRDWQKDLDYLDKKWGYLR